MDTKSLVTIRRVELPDSRHDQEFIGLLYIQDVGFILQVRKVRPLYTFLILSSKVVTQG